MQNSGWERDYRTMNANRGDGLHLAFDGAWWLKRTADAPPEPLSGGKTAIRTLDDAIGRADATLPPDGWSHDPVESKWTRPGWSVEPDRLVEGWRILRSPNGRKAKPATTRIFNSADRARTWAECRLDRTGSNLRGPKPRAGTPATANLPYVRATSGERNDAMALAKRLGLSYADMTRGLLAFAQAGVEAGNLTMGRNGDGTSRFEWRV